MPRFQPLTVVPALARYAEPQAAELRAEGIDRIVARSDRLLQPVQVSTRQGAIYFVWRREVPFAAFALDVSPDALQVRADGYAESDAARYEAALDFAVREAIRRTRDHNRLVEERDRVRR